MHCARHCIEMQPNVGFGMEALTPITPDMGRADH